MALESSTPVSFRMQHLVPTVIRTQKVTAADCVTIPKTKGIICMSGFVTPVGSALPNLVETPTYGTLVVNNTGTAYTTTSTSIVYDGGTCKNRVTPYYVMTNVGEIMEVTADSGKHTIAGTLTVRRGCLGTTAAAGTVTTGGLTDNSHLAVLNSIVLGATLGYVVLYGLELPNDPGVKLFYE
jgi:hypothetical protein